MSRHADQGGFEHVNIVAFEHPAARILKHPSRMRQTLEPEPFLQALTTKPKATMSIRLIATDLYRLRRQVERLETELAAAPAEQHEKLGAQLREARAERDRLRGILDGQKDSPPRQ
jgi:hypothetical protein